MVVQLSSKIFKVYYQNKFFYFYVLDLVKMVCEKDVHSSSITIMFEFSKISIAHEETKQGAKLTKSFECMVIRSIWR
jgi:hypothetical protein